MNKREAIQAMLEGKKVREIVWEDNYYIYMDDDLDMLGSDGEDALWNECFWDGWEIYND